MSGGSYNYLCHSDASELPEKLSDIESMASRLSGLGYADDAARETLELALIIRQFENRMEVISSRMSDVWRSVEWWDSCDSSEEGVKKALKEYRNV